jgi:predicted AlkP superfamily pyrophosphatase or phosphodiesterase
MVYTRSLVFSVLLLVLSIQVFGASRVVSPTVLLISVDGLKPEAVLRAQEHGLKLPNLVRLVEDGTYSSGVVGVLPTVTYPSHATLITGVTPAKHGISANTTFDPYGKNQEGWYWYAEDLKVPTLWDAAHAAGLTTASVYWPISVGAHIDFNLPQIWRTGNADDSKLQRSLSTPGLEQELVATLGRYPGGMEETIDADEVRTRFAVKIIETRHPAFMTVYLTGLDTEQHASGPFSEKSNEVLERLDLLVGQLRSAAEKASPANAYVCVVSDHGFASVQHDVNLYEAFLGAGLFSVDSAHKITAWKAMPWPAGGAAAIVLNDPKDGATAAKVEELLHRLAADPANGIDRVLTREELQRAGGFPEAADFVSLKIGYELGYNFDPPLISAPTHGGMHGYLSSNPEMRSSFFLVGPKVAHGKPLGEIDMRRIAPTLARILQVKLPDAELAPLDVH